MEANVQKDERVYRAIKRSKPNWLEEAKAISAMFKDIGGNSVDRDGGQSREDIIAFMDAGVFAKRLKGIVELHADKCMDIGTKIISAPTELNP